MKGAKRSPITRIMLLLDTNPTFHITLYAYEKSFFSVYLFFLFFPFILTGKRRFDLRVSSLISSIDRNLLPFFFLSLYKDATGLSRT